MKVLVATAATQGERATDFCTADEGEPVYFGVACQDPDNEVCGCGNVFTGLLSGKCTTTAQVQDVPQASTEQWTRLIGAYLGQSGWEGLYSSGGELMREARRDATGLAAIALEFTAGTVVERRLSGVAAREVAHAGH